MSVVGNGGDSGDPGNRRRLSKPPPLQHVQDQMQELIDFVRDTDGSFRHASIRVQMVDVEDHGQSRRRCLQTR